MLAATGCPPQIVDKFQCLIDDSWRTNNSIATSIAFSRRTANTVYSRANTTVVSISSISPATPLQISPADLFTVLNRFFSNGSSTTTTLTSFAAIYFANDLVGSTPYLITPQIFLRALLTLPLQWFQANLLSNTTVVQSSTSVIPNLPSELYVQGTLSQSGSRILIAKWTVIAYMVVGLGVYGWCVGCLVWAMFRQGPNISSFPLVDFAARIASTEGTLGSILATFGRLASAEGLRKQLEGMKVYFGELMTERINEDDDDLVGKIGFLEEKKHVQKLMKNKLYE